MAEPRYCPFCGQPLGSFFGNRIADGTFKLDGHTYTLPINNGQVEGHVTRVKLIKRMMYGKAGFALLRQRILHRI